MFKVKSRLAKAFVKLPIPRNLTEAKPRPMVGKKYGRFRRLKALLFRMVRTVFQNSMTPGSTVLETFNMDGYDL